MPVGYASVWQSAIEEFRRRQVASLRLTLGDRELGVHTADLDELLDVDHPDDVFVDRLTAAFAASLDGDGVPVLLAFYLLLVAREKWENSTAWPQIRRFLSASQRAAEQIAPVLQARDADEAAVVRAVLGYADTVISCTLVENALNCSCPADVAERAQEVVEGTSRTLADVGTWPAALAGPAQLLSAVAGTDHAYYSCLVEVAESVRAVVGEEVDARPLLRRTARRAGHAEADDAYLPHDVYGTELRAHRLTVEALDDLQDKNWLHVDFVRVVYCYPFSVALGERAVLARVAEQGTAWDLAGIRPVSVRSLRLTDMWEPPTERSARGTYSGVVLQLPDVTIATTDPGEGRGTVRAQSEVRFSALGNHYLRLELTLSDAHIHYVNQALRRPMDVMGYEDITTGGRTYRQLVEYASDVVTGLRGALDGTQSAAAPRRSSKDAHVVVSLRRLSVGPVGGPREPASGEAVLDPEVVGGSVLRQPVRQPAATLEEWTRYPEEADGTAVLRGVAFRGDVVVRTANTTTLAMTGMPDFLVKSYEESAEFVATLPVLLAKWRREVGESVNRAQGKLHRASDAKSLYEERQRLQDRIATIRADLAALHSPALTRTVMGRQFLDQLSQAAKLAEQEAHLQAQIEYAIATQEQYVTASEEAREEQERAVQRNLAIIGGVIGATSVAGAASLANTAFSASPAVVWIELGLVVLIAVVVVVIGLRRS